MGVHRGISVFVQNLQFIVEEYGVFPECRPAGGIDIREQTAFQLAACLWVQPSRLGSLHNDGSKKSVDVGPFFAAPCIAHIVEQVHALLSCVPGVDDFVAGSGIFVKSRAGPIGRLYVIIHPQHMDGKRPVQGMEESDHDFFAFVRPDDKGFYFFIRLGALFGKIAQRLFADAVCILFQHIQKPIWIMISIFVVDNGNLDGLDFIIAGLVRAGIVAKFHFSALLSCPFCFQDTDIVIGFPEHMVCQKGQDDGGDLSA